MSKNRALVIASKLPPLEGVHADAVAMSKLLRDREFEVDLRMNGDASRAGILEGFRRLIGNSARGDAAVLYYAGHGGHAINADAEPGQRRQLQCIFPTDWKDNGDFRGILDVELSALLQELTDKTLDKAANVTTIFDCCHSAELVRGPGDPHGALVPRVYGPAWAQGVPEFLREHPVDLSRTSVEGNRQAVRLVATAVDRRAYETDVEIDGKWVRRGLLTHSLQRTLGEIGAAPLTWRSIAARVAELVHESSREQRPLVEGPDDRLLFSTQTLERPDAVVIFRDQERWFLRAGRVNGLTTGAVYHVMPLGAAEYDKARAVATATVEGFVGPNAVVHLEQTRADQPAEPGAPAFPAESPVPPIPISGAGMTPAQLADLVDGSRCQPAPPDDAGRFQVRRVDGHLQLWDGDQEAATPLADDDAGRRLLRERLNRWAKAEALRSLVSEGLPVGTLEVVHGRVVDGALVPHGPEDGYAVEDLAYVTITNRSPQRLYVALFDIGIGGNVTLLTSGSPLGRIVEAGASTTVGRVLGEAVPRGMKLTWPEDVPRDGERRESFVTIGVPTPTDFTAFTTPPLRFRSRGTSSRLQRLLGTFREGTYRDVVGEGEPSADPFVVSRIDFDLSPAPRSAFAIDRSLKARALTTASRDLQALEAPPSWYALRINAITIHDNRALWGRASVRVDAVVVTGAASTNAYQVHTQPFPRAADGENLPLENMLVFEGPVDRFLDFGIWVSRDDKKSPTLSQLIDAERKDPELEAALLTLAGLGSPHAAVIVGVGYAVATLVSCAARVIDAAVDKSIGLYRCSFLPHEQFGLGRHPIAGTVHAQGFSFAYSIERTKPPAASAAGPQGSS